jgi:transposase
VAGVCGQWAAARGREAARSPRAAWRRDQPRGPHRGEGMGSSGHKHHKGDKVIAIIANHGDVCAPLPVAPVHDTAMGLLPEGLQALTKVATEVGLDRRGASRNRDGGLDSAHNRQGMVHAGLMPHITEHPRNRKPPKRGRKRCCNAAMHALRMRVERTFAWEEKCKRLLLRFEHIQPRHSGMKLLAYTLINLRKSCGT